MEQAINDAILILAKKITTSIQPDQALKFTQAALNLAHTQGVMTAVAKDQGAKKGAGS